MNEATRAYIVKMGNPYAKLSILPDEVPSIEQIDLLWKTRTDVYEYVSQAFSLPMLRTRRPALLTQFGQKVIKLGPKAQRALHQRISAHLPDENFVYNRLSPKDLDELLTKLHEMAHDAAALDGQTD